MSKLRFYLSIPVIVVLVYGAPVLVPSSLADGGPNHQIRNLHFGVSGGNVNDIGRAFCCGGTLGALVTDGSTQYVLSNNHILGRTEQALAGEDISQPGLIDNSCRAATVVANFTVAPPLAANVDAAIAELVPGAMDSTGFIEDIGTISSAVATPEVGLAVAKSGRTTGFTTGTVTSINTNVSVRYQTGCNMGRKFVVSFTNQIVVSGSTFSAGGDSGSLIVTNDAEHQPVALLYAGSSTTTIGNPAGEVLAALGASLGRTVSFVGGKKGAGGGPRDTATAAAIEPWVPSKGGRMPQLPQHAIENATRVMKANVERLMSLPSVIGVGVGEADDDAAEAVIVIYVDRTTGGRPQLPQRLENVSVKTVLTDTFVAR